MFRFLCTQVEATLISGMHRPDQDLQHRESRACNTEENLFLRCLFSPFMCFGCSSILSRSLNLIPSEQYLINFPIVYSFVLD